MIRPAPSSVARILAAALLLGAATPSLAAEGPNVQGATVIPAIDLGGLDTRSAALVFSGMEAGELPLQVAAATLPISSTDGARSLLVVVETTAAALLADNGDDNELIGELYVYALGTDGRLHDSRTRAFRLDLDVHGEALRAGGLEIVTDLRLQPDEYSLRVLLLHRRSGKLGLRTLPHTVPDGTGAGGSDAPLFARPAGGRLVIAAGAPSVLDPVLVGASFLPTADSRVAPGATPRIWVPGGDPDARAEAVIRSEGAADVALFSISDGDSAAVGQARVARIGTLDLPAGSYRLRVRAQPGDDSPERPFTIAPEDLPGTEDIETLASDGVASTPSGAVAVQTAIAAYRDSMEPAGRDGRSWDLEALDTLEESISGGRDSERLQTAQVRIAERLIRDDPEALVPLLHLHGRLYPLYLRSERYDAAQHDGALVRRLAQMYGESSPSAARHRIAGAALASLGGYRQEVGAELQALAAYLAALDLDAEQPAALIGAACVYESFGDYETAAGLLRRAVKSDPTLAEARLRLAVNDRRLGNDRRARASLRELAGGDVPAWISILAYQELSRTLVDAFHHSEADALLAEAMQRHPTNQRLAIQRAAVLDQLRRPADARQILGRIEVDKGEEGSPRLRYAGVPGDALEKARQLVAEAAAERRQAALQRLTALSEERVR